MTESVRRDPHESLRGLVTAYHGYHYSGLAPGVHHGLPSSELTVVIAFDEPLDVGWAGDEASRVRHRMLVSGLHTAPALIRHSGRQYGIQLGLTPLGARVLLGMPAAELAAAMVSLRELFAPEGDEVYDEVAGASSWPARFDVLERHLLRRAVNTPQRRASVRDELAWAWSCLERSHGAVRVDRLAREVGWSRRHLSARFTQEFGLAPKQLARVARLQRSRSRLLARDESLAAVATECGYADQAHMAREWRDLAGYSPSQWLRAEFPFLQAAVVSD